MVLAMGSPPAPHLANGWLSQFENLIEDDTKIIYMRDTWMIIYVEINQMLAGGTEIGRNEQYTQEPRVYPRNRSGLQLLISQHAINP